MLPYHLVYSDWDGARPKIITTSKEPILSPTWSPNAKQIAYVSFEGRRPSIYVHTIETNKREKMTSFVGLNAAPAWSSRWQ